MRKKLLKYEHFSPPPSCPSYCKIGDLNVHFSLTFFSRYTSEYLDNL